MKPINCLPLNICLIFIILSTTIFAQTTIPTNYYGINAWMPDSSGINRYYGKLNTKWQEIGDSKAQIVRIGGIGADKYFYTDYQLLNLIDSIRRIGAEPILQVPVWGGDSTAIHAARVVQFVNIDNSKNVRYWSIGNEPNHVYDNDAYGFGGNVYGRAEYAASVRAFSIAMKTVDPTIKTIAGELAWYYDVWINELIKPDGADDISGNNGTHDYIDYFSFHRYPFSRYGTNQTRALIVESPNAFVTVTNDLQALIATANSTHPRNNNLQYGLTEININTTNPLTNEPDGIGSNSFIAGQWWADMMQTGILQNAQFMNFWSAIEGSDGSITDNGYISHTTGKFKPIYYHFQLCAREMNGTAYAAIDNQDSIKVFAAKDTTGQWNILILNYDQTAAFNASIRLDNSTISGIENLKINIAGNMAQEVTASIPANSTTLLKINNAGTIVKTYTYTQTNALNDEPPSLNQVARTKKVFAHYLPWYDAADGNRTGWCYEGDCTNLTNVHYSNQPRIGEYSQYDSTVLEYHILTAYMAGIDGFIINLNPQWDLQKELTLKILDELNVLKEIYPELADFKIIISFDNSISDAIEIATYFTYIHDNIYQKPTYKDLIFVDEITGQQVLQAWSEGDNVSYYQNAHNLWGAANIHLMIRNPRIYDYSDGNFMWVNGMNNDDPTNTANWGEQYFNDFDWAMARQTDLVNIDNVNQVMMGMAYPGFNDGNVPDFWNGGVHRYFQRLVDDGETMALTWDRQINWTPLRFGGTYTIENPWMQLITWNDWPEGTSIEPATDDTYGYEALTTSRNKTETWKGASHPFATPCMKVPYHLYLARVEGATTVADSARTLLMQGDCTGATELLNSIVNPATDGTCLTEITIIENANTDYCAQDTIISNSQITASENINYTSEKAILLTTGFEVKAGATFLAKIETCCSMNFAENNPVITLEKRTTNAPQLVKKTTKIKVVPNPFNGQFELNYQATTEAELQLQVVNLLGQIIYQRTWQVGQGENQLSIPTGNWLAGNYFLQVIENGSVIDRLQLVKQD